MAERMNGYTEHDLRVIQTSATDGMIGPDVLFYAEQGDVFFPTHDTAQINSKSTTDNSQTEQVAFVSAPALQKDLKYVLETNE